MDKRGGKEMMGMDQEIQIKEVLSKQNKRMKFDWDSCGIYQWFCPNCKEIKQIHDTLSGGSE